MSGRTWIVLAALLFLLAAAAWWQLRPVGAVPAVPAPLPAKAEPAPAAAAAPSALAPTPAQIRDLQAKADAACLCARKLEDDPWNEGCWADFESSVARWDHSEFGTACREESIGGVCFPSSYEGLSNERCVFRERPYRGCSDEESRMRRLRARAAGRKGCSG